mmetsp:Transcript_37179/g.51599  ORF Transcript_37179/g.51599 Transcript_37179/m.51599 type:complete len:209 (-) Transcript_37179:824-1450(-)
MTDLRLLFLVATGAVGMTAVSGTTGTEEISASFKISELSMGTPIPALCSLNLGSCFQLTLPRNKGWNISNPNNLAICVSFSNTRFSGKMISSYFLHSFINRFSVSWSGCSTSCATFLCSRLPIQKHTRLEIRWLEAFLGLAFLQTSLIICSAKSSNCSGVGLFFLYALAAVRISTSSFFSMKPFRSKSASSKMRRAASFPGFTRLLSS